MKEMMRIYLKLTKLLKVRRQQRQDKRPREKMIAEFPAYGSKMPQEVLQKSTF